MLLCQGGTTSLCRYFSIILLLAILILVHKPRFLFQEIVTPQDLADYFIVHCIKLCKNRYHPFSATVSPESVAYFALGHFKFQCFLLSTFGPSVQRLLKLKKRRNKISPKPAPIAIHYSFCILISIDISYTTLLHTVCPPDGCHQRAYTGK